MRRILVVCLLLLSVQMAEAQGLSVSDTLIIPVGYKPDLGRSLWHDRIDADQKRILQSDGKADKLFTPSSKDEVNYLVTQALIKKVDNLQFLIETDSLFEHRFKVQYLTGLDNLLKYFEQNWKMKGERKVNPLNLPLILAAFEKSMALDRKQASIAEVVRNLPYDAGNNLLGARIFDTNAGYADAKNTLILKYCILHPDKIFATLQKSPDVPFADSLIKAIARKYPKQLYDYSQASDKLGNVIRNIHDDEFVQTVVRMARSKDGQQYFCFLDNILRKQISLAEIDAAKDDSLLYYRLLVKTHIDYARRALYRDTAYEFEDLTRRLEKKAKESFVNIINGLHEEDSAFRFRSIQNLTAEELYYLAVTSDGSIYTSSFVKGVYPLMMKKINYKGDSLLTTVAFDRYRKFIKMTAGFNMLSNFLGSFPPPASGEEGYAAKLMRAFVGGLESGSGLEDGVDVADSYASIVETIKPIADEMLRNVSRNYKRNEATGNKRGMVMYNILYKLFLSADSTQKIDLTKELGIPPVYEVPFKALTNDSGRVIVQLFIYGDKDGIGVFPGLLNMFNNANWKIDGSNKQWVTVNSAKGKAVSLYMNRPLPEETNEDALAQEALCKYLADKNIIPTVTINRGHSYNAPYTIEQMSPASRIVFMGSCGGYRMIHDILEKAPDAHIIGTKQIADVPVNNPFLKLLTDKLRTGSDIQWIPFWQELGKMVTDKIFEDYVPPYKNLGALFIKAYKLAMHEEEE